MDKEFLKTNNFLARNYWYLWVIKQYGEISSVIQFYHHGKGRVPFTAITSTYIVMCNYHNHRLWYFLETQILLFSHPLQILQAKNICSFDTALAYVTNFLFWAESLQKPADWLKIKKECWIP